MTQLALSLHCETRPVILGQPVIKTYFDQRARMPVDVIGGRFAGSEFVYILHLFGSIGRASHYVGSTNDVPRRMREHRKTWPVYRFADDSFHMLLEHLNTEQLATLTHMTGRTFRRKHTLLQAVARCVGQTVASDLAFVFLRSARRHVTNGLIMAANQRKIPWALAQVFQADRQWEFYLKKQKNIKRHCPICQGVDMPF